MDNWAIQLLINTPVLSVLLAGGLFLLWWRHHLLAKHFISLSLQHERLENQLRAINSGQLGMGREIRKFATEIANVEHVQQQESQKDSASKTFEQAGILLAKGVSIEEVVEVCEISPAEAELLAIMRNSAPSYSSFEQSEHGRLKKHQSTQFRARKSA